LTALLCLAPGAAIPYECFGWSPSTPSNTFHREPRAYLIYNGTGTRVFVYHPNTAAKYTFEPGQSGYLAHEGEELAFYPEQIRCEALQPGKICVIHAVTFDLVPGLILKAVAFRPPTRVPQNVAGARVRPSERARPVSPRRPASGVGNTPDRGRDSVSPRPRASADSSDTLRRFMERMVTVYYRSRAAEKDRKLAELDRIYREKLRPILSSELNKELEGYEDVCQCIHEKVRSGVGLPTIFKDKICGDRTTKQIRSDIVSKFERRLRYSARSAGIDRR